MQCEIGSRSAHLAKGIERRSTHGFKRALPSFPLLSCECSLAPPLQQSCLFLLLYVCGHLFKSLGNQGGLLKLYGAALSA